ncbi:MAG: hypothetical protein NZ902_04360 [Acidilobaceae archaeon]|nr:hypothetical protein [Acidilobaceae archaeon]MCX8165038.1 hypothetical protein [Acidilobaceae archaeon]MDW7974445.1 hypothetical protein [Sulfolobales archaeon]
MAIGQILGYLGGALAVVSGLVSIALQKPLISILTGIELGFIPASLLPILGGIGIIGGLVALYFSYTRVPMYVIIGGILGLAPPCALSLLAIIGGYLMMQEKSG